MNAGSEIERAFSEIFFPRPDLPFGPPAPGARDHMFDLGEGIQSRLRIFGLPPYGPVVLFFHGNGETARDYDDFSGGFRGLPSGFVAAEYRGYGPCGGAPTMENCLADAHKALDELLRLKEEAGRTGPVVVMGRSLGSAPAIELASSRQEVSALIVESGFALAVPLMRLIGVDVDRLGMEESHGPGNLSKMEDVDKPTLIIHAVNDEIIPVKDAELLSVAGPDGDLELMKVQGAGHNDIQAVAGEAYFGAVARLISRVAP